MSDSEWVVIPQANPKAAVRLVCLPYAGGGAEVFRGWPSGLHTAIEVCAIQLPGRGRRIKEAPFTSMPELIEALARALRPFLDRPFAIFGHDLGALIGFELIRRLRKNSDPQPKQLFVAARRAPPTSLKNPSRYNLPEPEFIEALREMNGMPAEVLAHPELLQLILPLLRAEFELDETYIYRPEPPLEVPISAWGGLQDHDPTPAEVEGWREQTAARFNLRMFPGDHFFLHAAQETLLNEISRELIVL